MTDASRHQRGSRPALASRVPFSLKFVALAFCLLGAALIADALAQLLTVGIVSFAFTLLFALIPLLIARGLLRFQSAARKWALFFAWLFIVGLSAGIVLITLDPSENSYLTFFGTQIHRPDDWRTLIFLGMLTYVGWQCYVLHSAAVRLLFTKQSQELATITGSTPQGGHLRFGLKKLFFVTLLCAVGFARLSGNELLVYLPHESSIWFAQAGGSTVVEFGYRSHRFFHVPDKMDYVIIIRHGTEGVAPLNVSKTYDSSGFVSASLHKPDGSVVELPNEIQLYECIDGKYRESREHVEKWQFDAWLASNPGKYSIDALLEYVKGHSNQEQ